MPTCKPCAGTGKRYPGFADAPHGTCLVCGGHGSTPEPPAPATPSPSPSYGPFVFTAHEEKQIKRAVYSRLLGKSLSDRLVFELISDIQSIINEGTEQES